MTEQFGFGALPSPLDERDYIAEEIYSHKARSITQLPVTLDLSIGLGRRNQGSRGTCAAFTAATIKTWQEKKDTGYVGPWSPEFVYTYRLNRPGAGMWGRDVMKILLYEGCPTEKSMPYRKSDLNGPEEIPDHVKEEAKQYCTKAYARVKTVQGLQEALVRDGPCYISVPVYNYGTRMWAPEQGQRRLGGHAMTVVGWTKEGFLILNSWGAKWGDNGTCVMPWYDFGRQWDLFTCIDTKGSPLPHWIKGDSEDSKDDDKSDKGDDDEDEKKKKKKKTKKKKLFGVIPLCC